MTQITALQDREEVLQHIQKVQNSFHITAPNFPANYPWLNTERPIAMEELRGKVLLLDFWTYCCINCIHTIPDLKFLEQKYANRPFAVIGVHSAKFTNERETGNVRQAIIRHDIEHPVIVDQNFGLWQAYAVHAWPTLVLNDPDGNIEAVFSGEGKRDTIDLYIDVLLEQYEKRGNLNYSPLPVHLEKDRRRESMLNYPGKVLADSDRQWVFVSDTDNNRILVMDFQGHLLHTIGGNHMGFSDGNFQSVQFQHPQGMALYKDKLLIADTENHAIRQVDFTTRQVRTLAGTGWQGHYHHVSGYGPEIPLSSPWDLIVIEDTCYITMAGSHQIWTLDLERLTVEAYAGTGQEARVDGGRKKAAFAQPSGITADPSGKYLFIADSEVSSIRMIDLERNGTVTTLAGGDLFEFGDEDGPGDQARFQHPLGIEYVNGKLYVADTYNHKIKIIDPQSRQSRSYLGTGKSGWKDGLAPEFYEPSDLSASDGKLFVADTDNHQIRVVDLRTHEVKTMAIQESNVAKPSNGDQKQALPVAQSIQEKVQNVAASGFILHVGIQIPKTQEFTPAAPFHYLLLGNNDAFDFPGLNEIQSLSNPLRTFEIPVKLKAGEGRYQLRLQLQYFYCDKTPSGTCKMRTVEHLIPIDVHRTGQTEVTIHDMPK